MLPSIPSAVVREVEAQTGTTVLRFSSAGGGCINHAGICQTKDNSFFLKWNSLQKFPSMFEAEAKGLHMLSKSGSLYVPKVVCCGKAEGFQFLVLETICVGTRAKDYWTNFGTGLARLHHTRAEKFGLDHDNYIGSLPQLNIQGSSWIEFFKEYRLKKQLQLAYDGGKVDLALRKGFETLFRKLPELLPNESPSLVHGDLWAGNTMTTAHGQPCLIDPAVYFGSREMDLAMTQLFGGFDNSFFKHYDTVFPLEPGYKERFDLYNLYPLLVHVNLFGGAYARQVASTLKKFI